jgi:hypothetical protein
LKNLLGLELPAAGGSRGVGIQASLFIDASLKKNISQLEKKVAILK